MDRRAHRQLLQEARLGRSELRTAARGLLGRGLQGHLPEQLAVTGLGGRQPGIEVAQVGIGQVLRQKRQTFLAAQLDQRGHQEAVEEALGPRLPHERLQGLRVGVARIAPEPEPAPIEDLEHLGQVAGLLAGEPRHRAREAGDVGEGGEHGKRVRRRLLLAVRVVDQHLVEAKGGQAHPGGRSGCKKVHGRACFAREAARGKAKRYPWGMRIGVISDTHGLLRPEAVSALRGADHLLHAGDIGGEEVLAALHEIAPVTAVAGNVDGFRCGHARATARVVLEGVRFYLTHILDRPRRPRPEVEAELRREAADVVVFGHSHLPHDEVLSGVRFFNPASAGPRRFDYPVSVGMLEVRRGRVVRSGFVPLDARSEAALQRHLNQLSR